MVMETVWNWHKFIVESLEIKPEIHGSLIFDKGAQKVEWEQGCIWAGVFFNPVLWMGACILLYVAVIHSFCF